MSTLLTLAFAIALLFYLGIAFVDVRHHYQQDGTPSAVTRGETALHIACGTLVTLIVSTLMLSGLVPLGASLRQSLLSVAPILLMIAGLVDEIVFHRPRCRHDPKENWDHALLHFSMGSTLVLAYVRWY